MNRIVFTTLGFLCLAYGLSFPIIEPILLPLVGVWGIYYQIDGWALLLLIGLFWCLGAYAGFCLLIRCAITNNDDVAGSFGLITGLFFSVFGVLFVLNGLGICGHQTNVVVPTIMDVWVIYSVLLGWAGVAMLLYARKSPAKL